MIDGTSSRIHEAREKLLESNDRDHRARAIADYVLLFIGFLPAIGTLILLSGCLLFGGR